MAELIDLLLHVDRYLLELAANYGTWIYGILFVIVFAETGLVVTPFLPGDSLLFAAGAIAASGALDARIAIVLLALAAIAGDAVNYSIGRSAGHRIIQLARLPEVNKQAVISIHTDIPQRLKRDRQNTFPTLAAGLGDDLLDPAFKRRQRRVAQDRELVAASESRFAKDGA